MRNPYTGITIGLIYQIYDQLIDPMIYLTTEVAELRENKRGEYVSSQLTNSKTLKVFPNPSFGVFFFNINGAVINEQVTLYLYNAQGVISLSDKRNINNKEVTTSGIPPGIYLLVVEMEDGERHVEKVTIW